MKYIVRGILAYDIEATVEAENTREAQHRAEEAVWRNIPSDIEVGTGFLWDLMTCSPTAHPTRVLRESSRGGRRGMKKRGGLEEYINRPSKPDTGQPGFFDLPSEQAECSDLSHNAPGHLHIPAGQAYRHICPSCGYTVVMRGPAIRW